MRLIELCPDCQRKARGETGPTIAGIITAVSRATLVSARDIKSARTNRSMVRARYIAMAIAYRITGHTSATIGDAFGGRDHTVVLTGARQFKAKLDACQAQLGDNATAVQWARAMVDEGVLAA